jgi:FKBP-type peptidyl-prolyl cis-trans isomerase FklB
MNLKFLAIVIMFFGVVTVKAQDPAATTPKAPEQPSTMTDKEKLSYTIGTMAGKSYLSYKKELDLDLDLEAVVKGLKDSYTGAKLQLSEEELNTVMTSWQKDMQQKQEEKLKIMSDKNKKDGDAYLQANKVKEGVLVIPNSGGVQYKILKAGDGPKPAETDSVEVNYKGTLINGKEFDSTYTRKQTATIPLNKIIPGWKMALLNMPVGSKWEVVIPSDQAYGVRGRSPAIEPNSTLIFEIELLGIKPAQEPKTQTPAPTPAPN